MSESKQSSNCIITGYKDKHEYTDERGVYSVVYLIDCMDLMQQLPDKSIQLACVDPPYGIGEDGKSSHSRGRNRKVKKYTPKSWDKKPPNHAYFERLISKSENQIIWGANHFIENIPDSNSSCWIVWDKDNSGDFADCELAWTSFDTAVRKFKWRWNGMLQQDMKNKENRIHPTQKPIPLYDWIFVKYAKECDTILDTHLGSGSSRISAAKAGLPFIGCELDEEYFYQHCKRFDAFTAQKTLFFPLQKTN